MENGVDVLICLHSHQDPSSTVLNVLQPLDAFSGDSIQKFVAVVQSRGDKCMDEFLCAGEGKSGTEIGNVS